jgi:hypothetical protein
MRAAVMAMAVAAVAAGLPRAEGGPYNGWKPLRYCNAPESMEAVRIPPLTEAQTATVASLEQVQVVARHGARAPYSRTFCWENQEHNPMTAEWRCRPTSVSVSGRGAGTRRRDAVGAFTERLTVGIVLDARSRRISGRTLRPGDLDACTARTT